MTVGDNSPFFILLYSNLIFNYRGLVVKKKEEKEKRIEPN